MPVHAKTPHRRPLCKNLHPPPQGCSDSLTQYSRKETSRLVQAIIILGKECGVMRSLFDVTPDSAVLIAL
ncbi:hypothetical protein MTO96_050172 [Rhipicephalus appendiculatus]